MRASFARTIALSVLLLLSLAGCKLALSQVSSATLEQYGAGRLLQARELTPSQVHALSDWFSRHETGWSSSFVSYVPALVVRARHADGDTSVVDIDSTMLIVYNRSGQYQQHFTPDELAEVLRIVEVT